MDMRLLAIINPAAGREAFQKNIRDMLEHLSTQSRYSKIDIRVTNRQDHAFDLAKYSGGVYDMIVAVGGDGTIHEVINGLVKGGHQTPLAIVAAGTVNDFAVAMELPTEVEEIRQMLLEPQIRLIDLGRCENDYFFNVCAGGLLTDVAYRTTRLSKTILGRLAYVLNAVVDLPLRLLRPLRLSIETDDEKIEGPMYLFMVCNTRSVGGFRTIAPDSDPEDGLLDIIAIRAKGPFAIFSVATLFLRTLNNTHVKHRNFYYKQSTKVKITELKDRDTVLDMDGERRGILPATIEVVPAVLPLVVPQNYPQKQ
ncbi:MAG: diacylglycerol kinase family lipid kinase [Clostridiaceae bacterium]|nr:diacylglycerol kinase family lipid kinase [Clostridiaceae bacterium]